MGALKPRNRRRGNGPERLPRPGLAAGLHPTPTMLRDQKLHTELIVDRVGQRTGLLDRDAIERAVEATVEVLAEHDLENDFDINAFYHRVSAREGISIERAMEHCQIICEVLAETVAEEERAHLAAHLPVEIERLLRVMTQRPT